MAKLPNKAEEQPVALELRAKPVLCIRMEDGPATEVPLERSTITGKPVRVLSDRRYLLRALQLGFAEIHVGDSGSALCCRDEQRTYVWMPLTSAPLRRAMPMPSAPPAPVGEPTPEPRRPIMPNLSTNGHRADDDRRGPAPSERPSLEELITEAKRANSARRSVPAECPLADGAEAATAP